MSFDRLIYIDRLKEAGVDETTARAHADALREALFESVATKSDLKEEVASIRSDLKEEARGIRADLKHEVGSLRADIKEEARSIRADLKEEARSIRAELKEEVGSIRADIKDNVTRLEHSIAILDRKIEITARDLTIKGAGGLVIIASIMIGLKLFG